MSDSEHSLVTYTSVPSPVKDYSDIRSPEVDGRPSPDYVPGPEEPEQAPLSPDYLLGPEEPEQAPLSPDYAPGPEEPEQAPLSPDYVPGPKEPEQAPPSPVYLPYVPKLVYPKYMPLEDDVFPAEEQPLPIAVTPTAESPGYIPEFDPKEDLEEDDEEDPEEDPADYPANSIVVALPVVDHVPSKEVTKPLPRKPSPLLPIPSPPPNSPTHIEILESCLPLQKRLRFASPTPSQEGVNQRVTNLSIIVDQETTIMYGMMEDAEDDRSQLRGRVNLLYRDRLVHHRLAVMIERERLGWLHASTLDLQASDRMRQGVIKELLAADHKRQKMVPKQTTRSTPVITTPAPKTTTSATNAQLQVMIDQGVTAAMAARNENRNGDDSHTSRMEIDKVERYVDGLLDTIHGSVMTTKPKTMQDAIELATKLMNKKINTWAERQTDNKRKSDDTTRNNHQQPNKRQNTRRAYAVGNGDRRAYKGPRPLCTKCNCYYDGPCAPKCHKCNRFGHLSRYCRNPLNVNTGANQRGNICFECGAQGHFKKECLKLKNNNNRGNQVGNAKAQAKVYAVGKAGANPDKNVVTGTFLLNNHYASILFDIGADRSFVSTTFSSRIVITPTVLHHDYNVELADGRFVGLNTIIRGCTLNFLIHPFNIDLIPVEHGSFDVIIGMDWLTTYYDVIVCDEKIVRVPFGNETLIIRCDGRNNGTQLNIISCTKTQKDSLKGYPVFLANITTKTIKDKSEEKRLKNVPIVRDFSKVFPEDLPGLLSTFQINLIPGATPVARAPYRLAPFEMKELSDQLQELTDKGFIRPSSSPWGAPSCLLKRRMDHFGCALTTEN
nr:putative reverse transcriptase domain-containing protein [Tanacetum cinerariifolium]